MEGSWRRARKRRRRAAAARLRRAIQSRRAVSLGKERRRLALTWGTSVGRKFRELQALVPGGEGLRADQLFLHTAGYILHLRMQMHVLRALSKLYVP